MKTYQFTYPGDRPVKAVEMNREEFQERFHDRSITISDGAVTDTIAIPDSTILCDLCNAEIEDVVTVVDGRRAYCPKCRAEYVEKYLTPIGND